MGMKNIKIFLLAGVLGLALACGPFSGEKTSALKTTETVPVSGTLDFATGLGKARRATDNGALEAGEVHLVNIATEAITEVVYSGTSFTAGVEPGDYLIRVLASDGTNLKLIFPSVTSSNAAAGAVSFESTVIAELVDKVKLEASGKSSLKELTSIAQSVADMKKLLADSPTVLGAATGYDNATRQAALTAQALRIKIRKDIVAKVNVATDTYQPSDAQVSENYSDAAKNLFSEFKLLEVVLSDTQVLSSAAQVSASVFIGFDVKTSLQTAGSFVSAPVTKSEVAVFSTVASDFSASATSSIDAGSFVTSATNKSFPTSDTSVRAFGKFFYVLGRFGADYVERFDVTSPANALYHYTTLDSGEKTQNPNDLIFAGMTKAYLTRHNSANQWIVNPVASSQAGFKIGQLELGHYADSDGTADISQGIIVGKKLFLFAQRLDRKKGWISNNTCYAIVIDVATDKEIDTGKAEAGSGLKGIALPIRNPVAVEVNATTGLIYVLGNGQFGSSFSGTPQLFSGGIATIHPDTYETKLLIDDGEETSAQGAFGGLTNNMAIVSATKGYLAIYAAWQKLTLRGFNPTTGAVGSPISGFTDMDIRDLKADSQGRLWIATGEGITVIHASDDSVVKSKISVGLIPTGIRFVKF